MTDYIRAIVYRDGSQQQLGGCLRDFRNKPFPVRVKVQYYKKALTVSGRFNALTV